MPKRTDDFEDDGGYEEDDERPLARSSRKQAFASKKVLAGVLGILLGCLGVHKFVIGRASAGIIMLIVSVIGMMSLLAGIFCFPLALPFFGTVVMGLIGLAEGIIYLTKTDDDFYQSYAVEKKSWF